MSQAKLMQVIETSSQKGKGIPGDPIRDVIEYWSINGELLAEKDSLNENNPFGSSTMELHP